MSNKLSFKIIGIIIIFSVGLYLFISINNIYSQKKNIMPLFIERAKATTYSIEASIRNEQELKDKERLLALIQKNIWLDSDIIDININVKQDKELITYVSNDPEQMSRKPDGDNLKSFQEDSFISQTIGSNSNETLKAVAPIHISGKIVGTIQITFDLSDINETINQVLRQEVINYGIIFIIFISVVSFVFRLIVIKPIIDINKGIEAIKNLNFDYQIKIGSNDEIGNLANAFNMMAMDLKKSRTELESYNDKLKRQVEEKTKDLEDAKQKLETINLDLEEKVKARTTELEKLKTNQEILIEQRTNELNQKVNELEKLNKFMINRENKMIELKKEIERLKGTKEPE